MTADLTNSGLTNSGLANGLLGAYEGFAQMLGRLDDTAWTTPTRCTGWEVRDIAGHVVGLADDAATGVPGSRTPDVTLAGGVRRLWWDTYAHTDDVHAALGLDADRGPDLAASVAYLAYQLTNRGWGPATLALDGLPQINVGAGGGKVTGDPHDFVLVASGRADPATLGLDASVNVYG